MMTKREAPFHVCYILKRYPRLSETFIVNEIRELLHQGIHVTILAQKDAEEPLVHEAIRNLDVPIFYLPPPSAIPRKNLSLRFLPRYTASPVTINSERLLGQGTAEDHMAMIQAAVVSPLIQQLGIDHLHAHFASWATTFATWASKLTGIPYSFTAHAKDIYHESVDANTLTNKIHGAKFVITVSDFNKRYLDNLVHSFQRQGKINRLYNGIDLERFAPFSGEREPRLILGIGRLVPKKGFDDLIEACKILKDTNTSFRCMIVGEGEERPTLEKRIAEHSLNKEITLVGAKSQEEVIGLLQRATMFVLPCKVGDDGNRDGLPTVTLEAMALGTPVISTNIVGIPEMIDHGQSGLLVEEKDPKGLALAIETLLQSPSLRETYSQAALVKTRQLFNLITNVKELKACFLLHSSQGRNGIS